MLTELSILIVSYIGIFVGSYLYSVAGQEVIDNKKEIYFFQQLLGIGIAISFLMMLPTTTANKLIAAALLATIVYFTEEYYPLTGLLVGLNPTFLVSSLVFLYGFPRGSLLHNRAYKNVFKKTYLFLILGVLGLILRKFLFI
ncbi:MAG TPA: hypothetical protein VKE88_00720 [Candidatus Nanoarchaeia archaeon]|nr:hypothetical protein [Candidatus Nanoarchaeia archaeon]